MRSINNSFVGISQLSDSYTDTTGLVSIAPRVSNCLCNHAKACHESQLLLLAGQFWWRPRAVLLKITSLPCARHSSTLPLQEPLLKKVELHPSA